MAEVSPRYLDAGETALVVEFGTTVDPQINDRVQALDAAFAALKLDGVRETVPTYRSLMIHYDPLVIDRAAVIAAVEGLEATPTVSSEPKNHWIIPCCYAHEYAEDLTRLAEMTKLTEERVVALHTSARYRVYMYGFAPGFCYLGGVPKELIVSRRETPRPPHPTNVVLLGGGLTLITTFSMPTGWWLIGRSPERMFSLKRDHNFFVDVGDTLQFAPVDAATYTALDARADTGEIVSRKTAA
jgi:KipI family sensor histidine kinase inhibitor